MAVADILETIQNNNLLKLLIVLGVIYVIFMYIKPQEGFITPERLENVENSVVQGAVEPDVFAEPAAESPAEPAAEPTAEKTLESVLAGSSNLKAEDLLPKYDDANEFAKENPVSKLLQEQNFLISGYHVGVNTVMQSNKIPYLDIRSLPPVAKEEVGPWNQSSFEQSPGQKRRFFEIGA